MSRPISICPAFVCHCRAIKSLALAVNKRCTNVWVGAILQIT
jgi:hypothetical protein